MSDAAVAALAARQHGLVTLDQALGCGLTRRAVQVRVASGRWQRVRRAVYAIAGSAGTWHQQVLAACLAVGQPVVASYATAARLWRLSVVLDEAVIDLTVRDGRRARLDGARVHRSASLPAADVARRRGIPVTSPARTLVDLAARLPQAHLAACVDDARRGRVVTLAELRACHRRLDTGPGRRPTVAMRRILAPRAPGSDPGGSDAEWRVARALARAGLPAPVPQHRVVLAGATYRLDLAWPRARVAVEFDGWDTHGTFTAFHGDRARLRRLVAAGWVVVPVTAETREEELARDVAAILDRTGERGA